MVLHHATGLEAAERLQTDIRNGLSRQEAARRLSQYGKNELRQEKKRGVFFRLLDQFKDFMILILLFAAAISFGISLMQGEADYIDSIMILVIVLLNAIIGVAQEMKADKAIEALKRLSSPHATVVRGGKKEVVDSALVVPGDLVLLKTGDLVPADIRLTKALELKAEESALTGESVPVEKDAEEICEKNAGLSEQKNMVFAGTGIAAGSGVGIVAATGMDTGMGKIASLLQNEVSPQTPLQERLKQLGKLLGIGVMAICALIFVLGLVQQKNPLEMFMIAISLAVASIPEGLPAVVTIVLAIGIKRMAQKRAIVRHMPAVETLGSTQVICSDKTGTLTQNKMTVVRFTAVFGEAKLDSGAAQFAFALCSLCNNSEKIGGKLVGDPTETAFLHACKTEKDVLESRYPRVGEIPFSSKRKRMTTAHKIENGYRIITKGAPDLLLPCCTHYQGGNGVADLGAGVKEKIKGENEKLASQALRVLAVAYKDVERLSDDDRETESGLIFCGLIAMEDPPRSGVKQAVHTCKKAGIHPVMITGDHAATALAIGKRIAIADENSKVMTGDRLDRISDADLAAHIFEFPVFARVSPEHKVRIVRAFQKSGMVVAMTGDGVNDAPALKAADIGCAMGEKGTEVAKSAADMVLTDDNFSTIVSAVQEGRGIYKNIRKTIHFLMSCNIGEILLIFVAFLLHVPTPLVAIQLLWVNLVTDSLPALALGADPIDRNVMREKPHKKSEGIFSGGMGFSVVMEGCMIGALALLAYTIGRTRFDVDPGNPIIGRTMGFAVLSFSQLVHSFNMRSERSVFKAGLFANKQLVGAFFVCAVLMCMVVSIPVLTPIFQTTLLSSLQWMIVAALAACPLLVVEMEKLLLHK